MDAVSGPSPNDDGANSGPHSEPTQCDTIKLTISPKLSTRDEMAKRAQNIADNRSLLASILGDIPDMSMTAATHRKPKPRRRSAAAPTVLPRETRSKATAGSNTKDTASMDPAEKDSDQVLIQHAIRSSSF
jgi:hypothetical protein